MPGLTTLAVLQRHVYEDGGALAPNPVPRSEQEYLAQYSMTHDDYAQLQELYAKNRKLREINLRHDAGRREALPSHSTRNVVLEKKGGFEYVTETRNQLVIKRQVQNSNLDGVHKNAQSQEFLKKQSRSQNSQKNIKITE
jgi:hypothetical protein